MHNFFKTLLIVPIKAYRFFISPFLPKSCRFYPSCSVYTIEAIKLHGPVKGGLFAVWRLMRCHPFSKSPYHDPVPGPCRDQNRGID